MNLTRRSFLVEGLRVTALAPALASVRGARAVEGDGERVLVVVQLTGGNDGLNTVVPHRQDAYARLRPTLALQRSALHALDDEHGLHPALGALAGSFAEGRLTVVQGVGYPQPDRSHFRSLEIWHTGDPLAPGGALGWLGRMADQILADRPGAMPALHVGDEDLPLALIGRDAFAPSVADLARLQLAELPGLAAARDEVLRAPHADAASDLAFLRAAAAGACAAARRLEHAVERARPGDYPDMELARKLRLVAQLVAGGFDTRVFLVALGGFDTHARQAPLHAALMAELDASLAAFERDLAARRQAKRVLTLVFSEFGRRTAENGSRGTDHGAAAPVLLLGGPGCGGVRGTAPDLERLVDGDVPHGVDFRSLYAAIERDWMGLAASSALPAFDLAH